MPLPDDERRPRDPGVQGEGDYISGTRYQREQHDFVRTHDTEQLARKAAPKSAGERRAMIEAEKKGRARAKGEAIARSKTGVKRAKTTKKAARSSAKPARRGK